MLSEHKWVQTILHRDTQDPDMTTQSKHPYMEMYNHSTIRYIAGIQCPTDMYVLMVSPFQQKH